MIRLNEYLMCSADDSRPINNWLNVFNTLKISNSWIKQESCAIAKMTARCALYK